jgi:hypothetical protein
MGTDEQRQNGNGYAPLGFEVLRGAAAGAVATGVMSAFMLAAQQAGLMGEQPPEKIADTALDAADVPAPGPTDEALAVVLHFAFGASCGALFQAVRSRVHPVEQLDDEPEWEPVAEGAAFGSLVWLVSYLGWLPALRIMPAPSRDRPGRPESMLLAHLLYGATLGACVRR